MLKFLRPHDAFPGETTADRLRQLGLRVAESRRHAELNAIWIDGAANCVISRFVAGRWAGTRESDELLSALMASGRGFLLDLSPPNLRITSAGPIAVDFAIAEDHPDWKSWLKHHRRPTKE